MISLSKGLPVLLVRMDLGGKLVEVMEDGENMSLGLLVVDLDRLEVVVIGAGIQMVEEGGEVGEEEEGVVETTGRIDEFLLRDLPEQADVAEEAGETVGTVAAEGVVPDRVLGALLLDDVVQLMTELVYVCITLYYYDIASALGALDIRKCTYTMCMDKCQTDMPITLLNTEIKAHKTRRFARTIEEKKG